MKSLFEVRLEDGIIYNKDITFFYSFMLDLERIESIIVEKSEYKIPRYSCSVSYFGENKVNSFYFDNKDGALKLAKNIKNALLAVYE